MIGPFAFYGHLGNGLTRVIWDHENPGSNPAGSTARQVESRTRPDGDGSSLQNCDSGFNSSRVCHVGDAEVVEAAVRKTALTGFESRLSLQSEGAKRRQRFLVPKTSAPETTRMGVRLLRPPPPH